MNAVNWFYSQPGIHAHAPTTKPAAKKAPVTPRIEATGGGWFTVHGGEHGPFDRHGREAADRALAMIVADRSAV